MTRHGPENNIADFVSACRGKVGIVLLPQAEETAREQLHLETVDAVFDYIVQLGVTAFTHQNSKLLEKGKLDPKPMVDAFSFDRGFNSRGYLAFYRHPKTLNWVIKSMKPHDEEKSLDGPVTHKPFADICALIEKQRMDKK